MKTDGLLYTFRGVVNETLSPGLVLRIGQAVGGELEREGHGRMLLAGDHRISTGMLKAALQAGLQGAGVDVVDCGMCPSPTLSFTVAHEGVPGAMVTASHNPPEWNGLQFLEPDSHIHGPAWEDRIKGAVIEEPPLCGWNEIGAREELAGAVAKHVDAVVERAAVGRRLKIVADLGSGVGTLAVPALLERLGVEAVLLHEELDPLFRQRPSEPQPGFLGRLSAEIKAQGADAGFAYDGDADRFVVLDENGDYVDGDRVMLLLCRELLTPGPVALNASTSLVTLQLLEEAGFQVELVRWGQTFMGEAVRTQRALFGGEPDGHYIWPELSLRGDAVASTAFFCELLSRGEKTLSKRVAELPATRILNETIEWDRDLADFRGPVARFGGRFAQFQELHPRLYVMTADHSKVAVRQSPFDRTLRVFTESYDPGRAADLMTEVKDLLL